MIRLDVTATVTSDVPTYVDNPSLISTIIMET